MANPYLDYAFENRTVRGVIQCRADEIAALLQT